ncbi:hypothetical protein OPKNFCMD_3604 [Methylobacterium crusticola]|uniref:Uncharacterized protein n=1 Tax=Methylobacterium crusticola TaxID=1697972 RepID=A0ABQ4R1Y5_9HYPH|nr:hypothetical protein [Methylobacterium crusticola]GJD50856.1 hypothetical protein OPKNFCMD_3604 [Methylobacterium crusticola]
MRGRLGIEGAADADRTPGAARAGTVAALGLRLAAVTLGTSLCVGTCLAYAVAPERRAPEPEAGRFALRLTTFAGDAAAPAAGDDGFRLRLR